MRLVANSILKLPNQSRLSDTRFAREQYDLAIAFIRSLPSTEKDLNFFITPD